MPLQHLMANTKPSPGCQRCLYFLSSWLTIWTAHGLSGLGGDMCVVQFHCGRYVIREGVVWLFLTCWMLHLIGRSDTRGTMALMVFHYNTKSIEIFVRTNPNFLLYDCCNILHVDTFALTYNEWAIEKFWVTIAYVSHKTSNWGEIIQCDSVWLSIRFNNNRYSLRSFQYAKIQYIAIFPKWTYYWLCRWNKISL